MDITYNILKEYEIEILPLLEEEPTIESFVRTVLDMAHIKYTFKLMKNMDSEIVDLIQQKSHKNLTPEELKIVEEFASKC